MKSDCRTYREQIADVAEGRAPAETVAHVEGCAACARRVRLYRQIFSAARLPRESAPASLVDAVSAMMPDLRRSTVARRLGALAPNAARRGTTDLQVLVGDEDASLRLLARPDGDGWLVMGRLPEGDWTFDGPPAELEADRFFFRAPTLAATAFALEGQSRRLEIPSLEELLGEDGSRG